MQIYCRKNWASVRFRCRFWANPSSLRAARISDLLLLNAADFIKTDASACHLALCATNSAMKNVNLDKVSVLRHSYSVSLQVYLRTEISIEVPQALVLPPGRSVLLKSGTCTCMMSSKAGSESYLKIELAGRPPAEMQATVATHWEETPVGQSVDWYWDGWPSPHAGWAHTSYWVHLKTVSPESMLSRRLTQHLQFSETIQLCRW
jgi:hypothetical protein